MAWIWAHWGRLMAAVVATLVISAWVGLLLGALMHEHACDVDGDPDSEEW